MKNEATLFLDRRNETIEDWDGLCYALTEEMQQPDDHLVHVDGPGVMEVGWWYHMVIMRDDHIHDAWCPGDALPLSEWLIKMFGADAHVEVMIDGDPVFEGLTQNYVEVH